jgi:Domain of unknown function (DUF397)
MSAPHWSQAAWFKSTRSAANGSCVEVAIDDIVGVRDSKNPHSPVLEFSYRNWNAFAQAIREGHFSK